MKIIFKVNNRIVPVSIDFKEHMDQAIDDVQSGAECHDSETKEKFRAKDVTKNGRLFLVFMKI